MTTKYVANLSEIINAVSDEYGIPAELIMSPQRRTQPISQARHVAFYLACKLTWMSKREIAACFNVADHASLYYGFNKVSALMLADLVVKKRVQALAQKLGQELK